MKFPVKVGYTLDLGYHVKDADGKSVDVEHVVRSLNLLEGYRAYVVDELETIKAKLDDLPKG